MHHLLKSLLNSNLKDKDTDMTKQKEHIVDSDFPDYILLPCADRNKSWAKIAKDFVGISYYRVNKKTNQVKCIVTFAPDKRQHAWDVCSKCYSWFTLCSCKEGVYPSRYVLHSLASANVVINGIKMPPLNEIFNGLPPVRKQVKESKIRKSLLMPPPETKTPKAKKAKVESVFEKSLHENEDGSNISLNEIDNLDFGKLNQLAKTEASFGIDAVSKITENQTNE